VVVVAAAVKMMTMTMTMVVVTSAGDSVGVVAKLMMVSGDAVARSGSNDSHGDNGGGLVTVMEVIIVPGLNEVGMAW
jgi:hypothetical protein